METFVIDVASLLNSTDQGGDVHDSESLQSYQWTIATSTADIVGFSPDKFELDLTDFTNDLGGGSLALQLSEDQNSIELHFAAAPEPATLALLGLGGVGLVLIRRRRT